MGVKTLQTLLEFFMVLDWFLNCWMVLDEATFCVKKRVLDRMYKITDILKLDWEAGCGRRKR